ncbi:hypothetical protein F5888DRAFT_1675826 [Russula emetica]|nr:hypothetical protein F5888DRAFT_1675826 [Russula emetica]
MSEITLTPSFLLIGRSCKEKFWIDYCTTSSSLFLPFSTITLFKNSFNPLPSLPSCIVVICSTAVAVDMSLVVKNIYTYNKFASQILCTDPDR